VRIRFGCRKIMIFKRYFFLIIVAIAWCDSLRAVAISHSFTAENGSRSFTGNLVEGLPGEFTFSGTATVTGASESGFNVYADPDSGRQLLYHATVSGTSSGSFSISFSLGVGQSLKGSSNYPYTAPFIVLYTRSGDPISQTVNCSTAFVNVAPGQTIPFTLSGSRGGAYSVGTVGHASATVDPVTGAGSLTIGDFSQPIEFFGSIGAAAGVSASSTVIFYSRTEIASYKVNIILDNSKSSVANTFTVWSADGPLEYTIPPNSSQMVEVSQNTAASVVVTKTDYNINNLGGNVWTLEGEATDYNSVLQAEVTLLPDELPEGVTVPVVTADVTSSGTPWTPDVTQPTASTSVWSSVNSTNAAAPVSALQSAEGVGKVVAAVDSLHKTFKDEAETIDRQALLDSVQNSAAPAANQAAGSALVPQASGTQTATENLSGGASSNFNVSLPLSGGGQFIGSLDPRLHSFTSGLASFVKALLVLISTGFLYAALVKSNDHALLVITCSQGTTAGTTDVLGTGSSIPTALVKAGIITAIIFAAVPLIYSAIVGNVNGISIMGAIFTNPVNAAVTAAGGSAGSWMVAFNDGVRLANGFIPIDHGLACIISYYVHKQTVQSILLGISSGLRWSVG